MRRVRKHKNLSSARHYDQIRFRFRTAKTLTGHSLKPRVASVGVTILWLRTLPPPPSTPINGGHADPLGENVVAT